ncbi:FtsK/SpoIIIE domain-containing protein [Rhodococcus erythropolis]|uniref:FtsK/SpoIIIE domain-containing protein n=1 Tax=Rhodococcus erythropolis TaxID=1833 RepID=UPI003811B594
MVVEYPEIVDARSGRFGPEVKVQMIGGQRLSEWEKAASPMASMTGASNLVVSEDSPGVMTLRSQTRDPLGTMQMASASSEGGLIDASTRIPIGRSLAGEDFSISVREDIIHMLMQGVSRFGKSSLTYLMMSWMVRMRDVEVWGFDHTGFVLGPLEGLPGKRAATDSVDDIAALMDSLLMLMRDRNARMKASKVDKVELLPDRSEMPDVVVVFEEFSGLTQLLIDHDLVSGAKPSEKKAPRFQAGIGRLASEGGKFGIKLLFLDQRFLVTPSLTSTTRINCNVRMTFLTDEGGVDLVIKDADAETVDRVTKFEQGRALVKMVGLPPFEMQADYLGGYATYLEQVDIAKSLWGVGISNV